MTGNMDNYFMPSEVARLILGYLIDRGLSRTMKTFIQECPDLAEFYQVMKSGRAPPTAIMGQSLLDMLNEFAELKLKSVRSGQSRAPAAVSAECSSTEKDAIICAREQVQETIKRQRLLWKGRKATQASAKKAREQTTTTLAVSLVDINTPVSSCRHAEGVSVSTPSCLVTLDSTPASSEVTSPGSEPTSARSHVTSPEHTSISVPSHVVSPVVTHISTPGVTNPERDVEPILADVAIAEVENMPDMLKEGQATDFLALPPSAQTNLDTQVQLELVTKHSEGPSHAKTAAEDNVDLLDWLLEDTNFHEKLAENINKVLHERDPTQSRKPVGTFSEATNKDLARMISKGLNINQIIERTESDPSFQNFLQLFQQGTAVPLSQFDVPVINISSEVTTGQSDHTLLPTACEVTAGQSELTSLPTACGVTAGQSETTSVPSTCEVAANQSGHISLPVASKTNSSEATPHSCEKVTVEPVSCQGNVSAVASACGVSSEPTNLLDIDAQKSSLLNPYDSEKLDEALPCDIGTTRVSETSQSCLSPTLKQSLSDDCNNHDRTNSLRQNNLSSFARPPKNFKDTEEYGSQNLADPNLSSSSQLLSSGISQKCVASDLNAVEDQVVTSESTGSKKSVVLENCCPQVQGSSLSAKTVSVLNTFVPANENSLTVFSLIEQSIAEMNGEQFVHRSMRNMLSSQTAGSVDTDISIGNRSGEHKNLSAAAAVCNNTSREAVCCEDIVTNQVDNHARTDSSSKTGSDNMKQPVIISMSVCSDQNASARPAETVVRDNSGTNDYIASTTGHVTEIAVNTKAFDAQASLSVGKNINVDQEDGQALFPRENDGYAVIDTRKSCLGLSGLKTMCIEMEASRSLPKLSEQNKTNNTQSPGKKNGDNLHNCTLYADCPVVIETENMKEVETNARNGCVSVRETHVVDKQESFCMSPPLRTPHRLQPTKAQPHTQKTCINKQAEVTRSQSLCNCSAGSTFQDEQITTVNGNSAHGFCQQPPVIMSPPYLASNLTDNNTHEQLCSSIYPQATCSSLPATLANVRVPGSPGFSPLSCHSSVKQTLQMTPPQGKQLHINSTEDNQLLPKTVKRRVIAFHSEHSPFIPDHCKKNPSRRIVPKEVDYSTPSPLQDCPSSPMNYMVDVSLSQPGSPHNSRESILRPSSSAKTLLNGHIRINPQRSLDAPYHNETSSSCSGAQSQAIEGQQKVKTPDVSLSHLEKLGIKLPPSPSKRKPRRIRPVQLSTVVNKDFSSVARSSSVVLHGGFSPVVDDARIVSSTSDNTTSSEEEAFRLLKSFLSSSYSKPQPRQEITSTDQNIGLSKCMSTSKLHSKHKGRARKNPPVKRNIVATTSEAQASDVSKKDILVAGDCDSTRRAQGSTEFVLSREDSVSKALNTQNHECLMGQSSANLCRDGNLPEKNSLCKVQCLRGAAQPPVSPCSHDSDVSFTPVGMIECFPVDSDQQVQGTDDCKMATASSNSFSCVTVCENIQNVPCLSQSKDDTFKGPSNKSCVLEELCSYPNDITGAAKVCAVTHKRTPEAKEMRFTNSRLASVDDDQVFMASSNGISQGKSPAAAGHYLPAGMQEAIPADRLTDADTDAAGRVRNVTACSDLQPSATISCVTNGAENHTCKHSTSTMKSLPSASSASEDKQKTASSDSLTLKNTEPAIFKGCHFTQPQLQSCSKKYHDSGGGFPSANSLSRLSNVSDGVADAVYSLLSLVSRVDDKTATNTISLADQNLSKDGTNEAGATDNLPMKNTKLSCHYPSPGASVAMTDSLLRTPVMSSDVSLPSLVCSSIKLAHDIEHPCDLTKNCFSPLKHGNSNWAGQGAKMTSDNLCNGHINTGRMRPGSPSSVSLLSKAMADSGIPFDGSNLVSPDTWTCTGGDISHSLPVSSTQTPVPCVQTPDVATPASARVNTESKLGRKPRPKAQKPNHRNLAQIVPSLGGQKFDVVEQNTLEMPVSSGSFVKILPRVSEASSAVLKPQVMDAQGKSSSLCQVQMIPSANGPIIIIPPGLEGIIHNLLSENNEPSPQVLHAENNVLVDNDLRVPTSCNVSIAGRPARTVSPAENLQGQFQSEAVVLGMAEETGSDRRKLDQSSAGLHTTVERDGKHQSDSLSSCAGEERARASSLKCVRKIAVRRRIDFTHLKSCSKRQVRKGKNKVKAGAVAGSNSPVNQGRLSGVAIAKDIKGKHLTSLSHVPGIKSSGENLACKDKRKSQDRAVQSKNTKVTCEVKRYSRDCAVEDDVVHGLCETNRWNSDLLRGDRRDQTKVPCETKKDGNICSVQSEMTKAAYEVKRQYKEYGDKTPMLCEDKKGSKDYSDRNNKTGVVCKVRKSSTSNKTHLADENHSGSKKAVQVNEQEYLSLSDSEELDKKCSGDKLLLSGSKCETVVSNKGIGSCGSTIGNQSSTAGNSAVSSLLILTQLLHERNKSQKSRKHEDKEEVTVCSDISEREVSASLDEHVHSLIHAKSLDLVKPSKNNSKVKAGKIHKKEPKVLGAIKIKDSRNNKSILPSPDSRTTVSICGTDSSRVKSPHCVPRKRKQKEMDLGVDQSDSVCKVIRLQVASDQPEMKEHHARSNQKSVRMVVDYAGGDNIVAGNLPEGIVDDFLKSKVEPEKQATILSPVSQLKSRNKSVLHKSSSKNSRNICNDNSTANKCITKGAVVQSKDKKLKTDDKTLAKLDDCQYVGSVSFRSIFSIFNTVCPQGTPSSQPSLVPVDGSVQQSSGKPQHTRAEKTSVAGTSHGHTTLRNRKKKAAAKHEQHTDTSDHTVTASSRDHAAPRNRKCKNVISTCDIGQGEKHPDFKRNQEMLNGSHDIDTASIVDVDCVASNVYDNETQNAVSALELCMGEVTSEHTHYFHKQPDPLCDVSSQVNTDHSSVNSLENSVCQMSNTSSPNTKLKPCNLHDVSPIKFHLPPKKRLSSEFIANGAADTLVQHDYNLPVLLDNDSTFNVHKLSTSQAHTPSVGTSQVLRDSSKPNTVSCDVESDAACHEPVTGDRILHTSQPTLLYQTSHADPLSTEIRGKTRDLSSVPVSHEDVTSLSTRLVVLPSQSSSIDTDSLHETGQEQSPLPSCSLDEQRKQGSTSPSVVSSDRNNPCEHRYDTDHSEQMPELPSMNKCEPHAVPESNVTLQTTDKPSTDPAELIEAHPVFRHNVDKLLRKLHQRKKTKRL